MPEKCFTLLASSEELGRLRQGGGFLASSQLCPVSVCEQFSLILHCSFNESNDVIKEEEKEEDDLETELELEGA